MGYAGTIATGTVRTNTLAFAGDVDEWTTSLISGLTYTVEQRGQDSGGGSLDDPYLYVERSGALVAYDDDSGAGYDARVSFQAGVTGTYTILAASFSDAFAGTYTLNLSMGMGTSGADNVTGTTAADAVDGGNGNDRISGLGGNDTLRGSAGNDELRGGEGNDLLTGGTGADVLIGGAGRDTFNFDDVGGSTPGARDIIRAGGSIAFDGAGSAAGDRIDLADIDANALTGANDTFVFGGTGRGHIWLTESGTNTILNANVDNDAAAEFQVVIEDAGARAAQYTAADFIL